MSINNLPILTIITVVYNGEKYLERTIQSVLTQSYKYLEYIIIDGGSTDDTINIINKYINNISIFISEKDDGIYDAMNKGIKNAKGNLIGIINSDDWYEPNAFELVINEYLQYKYFVFHGRMKIWRNDEPLYTHLNRHPEKTLIKGMCINHPTVFIPKTIYDTVGTFNIQYKIAADWDLMIRILKNNYHFHYINENIANFSLNGISSKISNQTISEKHLIRKNNHIYNVMDIHYILDIIKISIFKGNILYNISIYKEYIKYIFINLLKY